MNKEKLLEEIMKLPKIEAVNPISAMNSINVDDLMSAVDRLNKIPDYNDLLKENQNLKKQLEKKQNPLQGIFSQVNDDMLLRDCGAMQSEIDEYKTQQKEFIKYLENRIDICDGFLDTVKSDLQETPYGVISANEDITTQIKENETAHKVYEEILQKYKSIIGDDK